MICVPIISSIIVEKSLNWIPRDPCDYPSSVMYLASYTIYLRLIIFAWDNLKRNEHSLIHEDWVMSCMWEYFINYKGQCRHRNTCLELSLVIYSTWYCLSDLWPLYWKSMRESSYENSTPLKSRNASCLSCGKYLRCTCHRNCNNVML